MEQMNEIRGYVDEAGRVTALPSKRRKKILVLCYLSEKIPNGANYTEREFTDFLNTLHTFGDPATLRREMYDYYLINRSRDGQDYSLNPERPSPEELLKKYCG